jgi:hypothetical protein
MTAHFKDPLLWLYGLLNAFIGGGVGAVGLIIVDPKVFNLGDGLRHVAEAFVATGLVSAASYLKKSPLPDLVETTVITSTVTKTTSGTVPQTESEIVNEIKSS